MKSRFAFWGLLLVVLSSFINSCIPSDNLDCVVESYTQYLRKTHPENENFVGDFIPIINKEEPIRIDSDSLFICFNPKLFCAEEIVFEMPSVIPQAMALSEVIHFLNIKDIQVISDSEYRGRKAGVDLSDFFNLKLNTYQPSFRRIDSVANHKVERNQTLFVKVDKAPKNLKKHQLKFSFLFSKGGLVSASIHPLILE